MITSTRKLKRTIIILDLGMVATSTHVGIALIHTAVL